ncbi:DUF397 domain-containing protein [Streptomyces thioluteus]|uniref:DUF397 domain-containing protein n=2 Tax=Streptomyces thioluteus TaxID=66431 RepID=A0ABP6IWB5_STRTU
MTSAVWRKSSHSNGGDGTGGGSCLELADNIPGLLLVRDSKWRKSSYSGGGDGTGGNDCVEVADNIPGLTPVRDSKSPHPTLTFPTPSWAAFVARLA